MITWSYGVNSIYKQVSIYLEEASWWVFVVDKIVESLCDLIPSLPLPNIKMRLHNKEDIECNGGSELTTLRDWYGDLSQVFHRFIHMPVFDFCQKRIECKQFEVDYYEAIKIFQEEDKVQ